ncbi:YciI family protein [Stieleria sp. JC731]|uniref:YciI family protein n=1 Tax=Pirellulaceae TaxID=2691357 RepID=UPI001E40C003|nr:YciI family protein [Stieleria sp. JC731]MCC9599435.1 YciI family protein [Stieleria sp. JC731]
MKFLVLMYGREDAWPGEEHREAIAESVQVCHDLNEKGQFLAAAPLEKASRAKCVRVRDGKASVQDGPFAETKEVLGGYFLIDVDDMDQAIEVAKRIPGARRGIAEIRPVMEVEGLPE